MRTRLTPFQPLLIACLFVAIGEFDTSIVYGTAIAADQIDGQESPAAEPSQTDSAETLNDISLGKKLESLREKCGVPALGALVMSDGIVVAKAAVGERKLGSKVMVTTDDKWHHGSITKSMTATLIARMVQRGQLDWNDTLEELLPELSQEMHKDWKSVTLIQLLSHTSGARANFPFTVMVNFPDSVEETAKARAMTVAYELRFKPSDPPGARFRYSNVGYTIAGYVASTVGGKPWETLIREDVFEPLGLSSAGFRAPRGKAPLDQPWGHVRLLNFSQSVDPDGMSDNSPIIGPAGIVHMSMHDLAKYGWAHLSGEQGGSDFLKPELFQKLHTPVSGDYGCGWVIADSNDGLGRVIWHNGSNTKWMSYLHLIPERNVVLVLVCNDGQIQKIRDAFKELKSDLSDEYPVSKLKSAPTADTGS